MKHFLQVLQKFGQKKKHSYSGSKNPDFARAPDPSSGSGFDHSLSTFGQKNQLSGSKTKTYRTIRVSWSGSEEVYLLKSSVRPPEVYLRWFWYTSLSIRFRPSWWALLSLCKRLERGTIDRVAFNFERPSYDPLFLKKHVSPFSVNTYL